MDLFLLSWIMETTGGISSAAQKFLEELFVCMYMYEGQAGRKQ